MARIKIKDLAKDQKISRDELKKVFGGTRSAKQPYLQSGYYLESDPYVINDPSPVGAPDFSKWFRSVSAIGGKKR
ncbi:MAG: hypothetical protein KAJ08_03875 [Deltaproteobacteria bacterium]|nr:hypothetical protein [Deltaproteobacteria bacterium]